MLANVKQATIGPLIEATIAQGTLVYTDEYDIYARLAEWGYAHQTVCHAARRVRPGRRRRRVLRGARQHDGGVLVAAALAGCGRTGASRRRSCRCTWASSSSCTTSAGGAKPSSAHSSPPWSHETSTPDPEKSVFQICESQRRSLRSCSCTLRLASDRRFSIISAMNFLIVHFTHPQ